MICTYLCRQWAHCRAGDILYCQYKIEKYSSQNTKLNKKGLYLHSIELSVDILNLRPLTPARISLMNPSQ